MREVASSKYRSQGWGYFGIECWGGAKPLFVGWGWGLLSGAVWKMTSSVLFCSVLFCSVLFCSVPTWLEVCQAVVREFFYSQKRSIIIILVPQPHDPFFLLGQGRGVPEASPPHSQIQDVCVTFVIIINNCRKS